MAAIDVFKAAFEVFLGVTRGVHDAADGFGDILAAYHTGAEAEFLSDAIPQPTGAVGAAGTGTKASRDDHVHATAGGAGLVTKRGASIINVPLVASGGGTQTVNVTDFLDEGTILYLKLDAAAATLLTTLEFYGDDGFTTQWYESGDFDCNTTSYVEMVPIYYRDLDATDELHVKVTNNGSVASAYTLEVVAIGE